MKTKTLANNIAVAFAVIAFLALLFFGLTYMANVAFQPKIKEAIVSGIAAKTGKITSVEDVGVSLLKGIVVKGLTLYEGPEDKKEILFKAGEARFTWLIIPIFKKKFIIPSIRINKIELNLKRDAESGDWNVAKIFDSFDSEDSKKGYAIIIRKITLEEVILHIKDSLVSPAFSKDIYASELNVALSPSGAKYAARGSFDRQNTNSSFSLKGRYLYGNKNIKASLKVKRLMLPELAPYFQDKIPAKINKAVCSANLDLIVKALKELTIKGNYIASDTALEYQDYKCSGDLFGDFELSSSLPMQGLSSYKISFNLSDYNVKNIPYVQAISGINGKVLCEPDAIIASKLDGKIADTPVHISVNVTDLKENPLLDAEFYSDLDLKNVRGILTGGMPKAEFGGRAIVKLNIKDRLNDASKADISAKIDLKDASLKLEPLPTAIDDINGTINVKNELVSTDKISLNFMNDAYTISGSSKGFEKPDLDIRLETEKFSLTTQFSLAQENAHIKKADIKYRGFYATVTGDIYKIYEPVLDLHGKTMFSFNEIAPYLSNRYPFLKDLPLDAVFKCDVFLNGKAKTPRLLDIGLKLSSDKISIGKFRAYNLDAKVASKAGEAKLEYLKLEPYQGVVEITGEASFDKEKIPYEITGRIKGVQLMPLIEDMTQKETGVYGTLDSSFSFYGVSGSDYSIQGNGWIHVTNAHLGPLPIFLPVINSLADFISTRIAGYERVKLKEGTGTFKIADRKITTDDLTMWGDEASILYKGSVDFDGNLDFTVENNFVEGLTGSEGKEPMEKSIAVFITEMGRFIGEARLTGTIKKPKYEFKALPVDKFFKEKFKNIFEGIFQ